MRKRFLVVTRSIHRCFFFASQLRRPANTYLCRLSGSGVRNTRKPLVPYLLFHSADDFLTREKLRQIFYKWPVSSSKKKLLKLSINPS